MVRKRRHAVDGIAPKARLQALDELGPLLGLGDAVAEKPATWRAERHKIAGIECDCFYRLRKHYRRQLLAQQNREALGIARRRSELHLHGAPRAIVMRERQRECTNPGLASGKQAGELCEQAARGK